ncbi:hypothetical protein A2335_02490 [Candidatus Peregrinibacteria bacterium RIFOXYB2_FULL_32_7]|nr:MAG: hypothetical protein A2335_02490 [Candidatus Peregrinibacteria bacterium RIFOXYB2_FULL_32_7]
MKKFFKVLVIIILAVVVIMFVFLSYFGAFEKIEIVEKEAGPYNFVYEDHTGAYIDIGSVFDEMEGRLNEDGIEYVASLGIYYDNPTQVAEENLRSKGGYILSDEMYAKVEALNTYKRMKIEAKKYITIEYPYKHTITMMFAPMRVYPKFAAYLKKKGYRQEGLALEMYEDEKISYMMEIIK